MNAMPHAIYAGNGGQKIEVINIYRTVYITSRERWPG
jgi:hypothetical protein